MTIGKDIGFDNHAVADHALRRIAAVVDARFQVGDDDAPGGKCGIDIDRDLGALGLQARLRSLVGLRLDRHLQRFGEPRGRPQMAFVVECCAAEIHRQHHAVAGTRGQRAHLATGTFEHRVTNGLAARLIERTIEQRQHGDGWIAGLEPGAQQRRRTPVDELRAFREIADQGLLQRLQACGCSQPEAGDAGVQPGAELRPPVAGHCRQLRRRGAQFKRGGRWYRGTGIERGHVVARWHAEPVAMFDRDRAAGCGAIEQHIEVKSQSMLLRFLNQQRQHLGR